ncbi:MAG: substrate-binding domain-containing protein, partial [Erysipelotrichaceae bacterium]|nr:substrate-binding domain-containing protein [Erysipelotrichaceae bacterium]
AGINEMNEIIDNVVKSRADGLILYNDAFSAKEMEILNNFQIPTVYLGNKGEGDSACCVYIDYEQAVYELVTRYLNKGVDDIVIIDDRKNPTSIDLLIQGASKAFTEHGKTFGGYITIPEDVHNSYEFLSNYFAHNKHKLVIAYRDSQAIAVINTCTENNIRIPDETELVCIKDSRYTDMFRPRISSFIVPSYDLGALAMRIMTKLLSGDIVRDKEFKLNYVFKPKETTK